MNRTTLLHCENLDCADCVRHVQQALEHHSGVFDVAIDPGDHAVRIRHDDGDAPAEVLAAFVTLCGFPARVAA